MRNLKVIISYNGAAYHGFQKQESGVATVQGVLEAALTRLLNAGEPACVTGCGRTDAGVHARAFCFNTRTNSAIPCDGFVKGLNALLPPDIAVASCEEADGDFHARYSAKSKEYAYLIYGGEVRDVFTRDLAYFYPFALDTDKMRRAAELFIGEHDFSAYCKAESLKAVKNKKRGAIREITVFDIINKGDYVECIVRGNGFLHNMVRIMTGTLVYVSEGKRTAEDIKASLTTGNRTLAGITLPPRGLYLNRVFY